MKMWSVTVITLLLFCYGCLSTASWKVYFRSRNFHNTLHWDPVSPALFPGENVTYSVQYTSDAEGQSYQIKEGCQNISALSCDLTAETPSVEDVHYWAQVWVNSRCLGVTNHKFKPIADTIFGPPILTIYTTVSSLHLNVSLPLGPNEVSVANIITNSKNGPFKTEIDYTLKITHPVWAAQEYETKTGQFVVNLKNNKTEYCGYVVYKPSIELGRSESENATFCVILPAAPLRPLPWLLTSATLLAAIVIAVGVCMCNYVKGGKEKSMPQRLVNTLSTRPVILQSPDGNLIISKLVICTETDQTVYATIQMKPNVPPVGVGGYSPQDILCQAWQDRSGSSVGTGAASPAPNPEDTSAQSSEIYSMVAVHVPAEEMETSNLQLSTGGSWDEGRMSSKVTSHGVPPLPAPDSCDSDQARPLLLHTVRDPNGQLMLPLLNFQLPRSTGDTERKPLLSDLIDSKQEGPTLASLQSFDGSEWSDSGCGSTVNTPTQQYCNTHYCPSQPVAPDFQPGCQNTSSSSDASFESGYKHNWMPSILEAASKDSSEYRKTDYPWNWTGDKQEDEAEDVEDRVGEEESRKIILGNWVLQIQD
ncbi:interferon lambda receptor 1 [Acanthopagrus schlegelii]